MFSRIFIIGVLFAAAGVASAMKPLDDIVAVVNNESITRLEVEREVLRLQTPPREEPKDELAARKNALKDLIDRRLQLQYADIYGIQVSDDFFEQQLQSLKKEQGVTNESDFVKIAEKISGLSYDIFIKQFREDLRIQSLFYRSVYATVEIKNEEVDDFLKTKTDYISPQEYKLRHIIIAKDDQSTTKKKAENLQARLLQGEDFIVLAQQESDGKFAEKGGELGFREEKQLPTVFVQALKNLTVGETSSVLESQRGFHIIRLEEKRGGQLRLESVERFRLQHLHLPLEEKNKADDIFQDIGGGADFDDLVLIHSIDTNKSSRGGDLGWFTTDTIPPFFTDAVEALKEGEISAPIQSPYGWHLLRLSQYKKENLTLEIVKNRVLNILRENKALKAHDKWLQSLREKSYITIVAPDLLPDDDF